MVVVQVLIAQVIGRQLFWKQVGVVHTEVSISDEFVYIEIELS